MARSGTARTPPACGWLGGGFRGLPRRPRSAPSPLAGLTVGKALEPEPGHRLPKQFLDLGDGAKGSLVFIRFGGPSYKPDQIRLAEFIAVHVAQLFEYGQLVQKVVSLEAQRGLDRLQEDFIATVSHELLTPLGFIKGYATTLLRDDTSWDAIPGENSC